jgi:outer membrane immunogenic protein
MKRILLAGAAVAAMTTGSFAADYSAPADVDVWSGFFVGIAGGGSFKTLNTDVDNGVAEGDLDSDDFIIGAYYGRNWQSGNFVFGIDSSFNYIGFDEEDIFDGLGPELDVEANFLGLSRLKVGYAVDNTLFYAAGGLATTIIEATAFSLGVAIDDDDDWAFGFTVGAGMEHKFSDNWSARLEYSYFNIESDVELAGTPVDFELEGHIIRGGVAYHF